MCNQQTYKLAPFPMAKSDRLSQFQVHVQLWATDLFSGETKLLFSPNPVNNSTL